MPIENNGLRDFLYKITESASDEARARLAVDLGNAFVSQVQEQFASSVDAYGSPLKPLKSRKGQPLLDTGILRNSYTYDANYSGVRIGSRLKYAAVHQFGSNHAIPARAQKNYHDKSGKFTAKHWKRGQVIRQGIIGAHRANIPPRPMLPLDESRNTGGLGLVWTKLIRDEVAIWAKKVLK